MHAVRLQLEAIINWAGQFTASRRYRQLLSNMKENIWELIFNTPMPDRLTYAI